MANTDFKRAVQNILNQIAVDTDKLIPFTKNKKMSISVKDAADVKNKVKAMSGVAESAYDVILGGKKA